ncbi:hypothetical protein BC826DRAFT_972513 [Russula brevipes]|nr:hypothetical protein BC826DRAFT_972513 [Russula brevipes]
MRLPPAVCDAPAVLCARCACHLLSAMRLPSAVCDAPTIRYSRCACVWATSSQHRPTQIVGEAVSWWQLLPWEPARVVPAVRDAPAFGQPARSAIRCGPRALRADRRSQGGVREELRVVAGAATVWVTKVTVVVWAAYSSGGGDVDSAAGRQRRGRQEKRRPSPNDRGSWQGREATEGRARCWRSTTRLMGGGGDLAMAWNEGEKNGKEQGGARVGGRSERADAPWSEVFSTQCRRTLLTTPARHEEEEGSGQQAIVGQPAAHPYTAVRVTVCHGVAESNTAPAPVTPVTVTPRENPHP